MLANKLVEFLKKREFIYVATCDFNCRPNAAPKFFLKYENNFIYLVDSHLSRTWENLKINPQASLTFLDAETLLGYQINGPVEIIEKGEEYKKILDGFDERKISLSARRIIEGLSRGRPHETFEINFPETFGIFRIKIEEIVEIRPGGDLTREKI